MCHKYPGLGRVDEDESDKKNKIKRIFYINNDLYDKTYHGAINCNSCHTDITRIPHGEVKKVDCASACHIIDPSSSKPFSHKKIVSDYSASVHGQQGSNTLYKDDLPVCKDCHSNKAYHAKFDERVRGMEFLKVCEECHQSGEFTKRFYEHITYRTTKRRPSREVVRLCSTCHADRALMDKHQLDVVVGFANTFHAKALSYGNTEVPNCLNCHAPYQMGFSPHRIASSKDADSPSNPANRLQTCSQSGCHTEAGAYFASGGYVHPSLQKIEITRTMLTADDAPGELVRTQLESKIIGWIQLFYKILIPLVVGGLGMHRVLVFYASRRDRKRGGHVT